MLEDLLKRKKYFKLVCGAGNEDVVEVEKLVALYAKAGCRVFDLSANKDVLLAAKKGLDFSIPKNEQKNFYLCVSVGIKGDPHTKKATINQTKCTSCKKCIPVCPQSAILQEKTAILVKEKSCIGCGKCEQVCRSGAIGFRFENKDLRQVLPPLIEDGIDCLELHAIGSNEKEVDEKWGILNELYDGVLSICVDRSKLSDEKLIARLERLLSKRKPFSTIIQADGAPMSGGEDDYATTIQAVATGGIVQKADFEAFLVLSGGTNSKTAELARLCDVKIDGVAIGSFARKIVKEYVTREDFLQNQEVFNKALKIAENLVRIYS